SPLDENETPRILRVVRTSPAPELLLPKIPAAIRSRRSGRQTPSPLHCPPVPLLTHNPPCQSPSPHTPRATSLRQASRLSRRSINDRSTETPLPARYTSVPPAPVDAGICCKTL